MGLLDNFANNPLTGLGAGLLAAGGPSLNPADVSTGRGIQRGLGNMAGIENQRFKRQLLGERQRQAQMEMALERRKFEAEQQASAREMELRGLLAKDLKKGDIDAVRGTLALLGEGKDAAKGLLSGGGDSAFAGKGMQAQALSVVAEVGKLQAEGKPIPPELQRKFELAKWHLRQPKPAGFDPISGQTISNPPPLPGFGGAPPASAGPQPATQAPTVPLDGIPGEPPVSQVMGALPAAPREQPSVLEDMIKNMDPGAFLSREQLIATGFPADAKAQVTRSRGTGIRSLKMIDAGTKQGAESRKAAQRMGGVGKIADEFNALADANDSDVGPIAGRMTQMQSAIGVASEAQAELVSMQMQMSTLLGNALSGAAIPESEWPKYQAMVPLASDNKNTRTAKTKTYKRMITILNEMAAGGAQRGDLDRAVSKSGWSIERAD